MMGTMMNTARKGLKKKADRTPEEDEMLDILENGENKVCEENLGQILNWMTSFY